MLVSEPTVFVYFKYVALYHKSGSKLLKRVSYSEILKYQLFELPIYE